MQFHWIKWLWINRQQISAFQGLHAVPPGRDVNKFQAVFVGSQTCPPKSSRAGYVQGWWRSSEGTVWAGPGHPPGRKSWSKWQQTRQCKKILWCYKMGRGERRASVHAFRRHQAIRVVFLPYFLLCRGVDGWSVPVNFRLDKGLLG